MMPANAPEAHSVGDPDWSQPAAGTGRPPQGGTRQHPPHAPLGLIERIYVYFIASTAVMLVALLAVAVYLRGVISAQSLRIEELARRVQQLESQPGPRPAPRPDLAASPPAAENQTPVPQEAPRAGQPAPDQVTAVQSRPTSQAPAKDDAALGRLLDRALKPGRRLPLVIADGSAAEAALKLASELSDPAACRPDTWERLAVAARLLGRESLGDELARRAGRGGSVLAAYAETSARLLLAAGRPQEAFAHAEHLARQTAGAPAARVLLARVLICLRAYAAADELLSWIEDASALTPPQRLELAQACADLGQWERFGQIVDTLPSAPQGLESEYSFCWAISQIQRQQRLVEALAALDYLSDAAASVEPTDADGAVVPGPYEVAVWRAVALLRGKQAATAQQSLESLAAAQPQRPEAHYWLAIAALHQDMPETARAHLQQALTASEYFLPAWETLASIELNSGQITDAVRAIQRALELNGRRPSSHFLLAIAHAKAGRRDAAAESLRKAFGLDPAYLAKALESDLLTRLFTAAELRALLPEADPDRQTVQREGAATASAPAGPSTQPRAPAP